VADVVRLIVLGYGNQHIAAQLEIDVKTVETHNARALERPGVRSDVECIQHALRQG
jgi:DNA-binding NarL/FixJ family response regulator